ncbi:hypothetical protein S245_052163 [Arachis hypogaea]
MPPYDPKTNYFFITNLDQGRNSAVRVSYLEAEEVSSDEAVMEEESQSSDEPRSPAEGTIEAKPKRRFSMKSLAFWSDYSPLICCSLHLSRQFSGGSSYSV